MYSHGLAANTTSLARMQVSGFASLTDGDIRAIVGSSMFIDMPCPTDLFLELVHITRLRVLVAERSILPGHTQAIADTIFDRIDGFDPGRWTESYKLPDTPVIASIARTYKTAVLLYGVMALPPSAYTSWSASRGVSHTYHRLLAAHRSELLAQARTAWDLLRSRSALCWPLLVAGAALAGGGGKAREQDRAFVAASVGAIWLHPNAYCGPIVCLDKIQALWRSGKTGWEDCFDEPVPPIP